MSSTEGSGGGEPLRLSKDPVERPPVIPRGVLDVALPFPAECDACRMDFTIRVPGFDLHYHNIMVTRSRATNSLSAAVLEDDVVTWEKLDAQ